MEVYNLLNTNSKKTESDTKNNMEPRQLLHLLNTTNSNNKNRDKNNPSDKEVFTNPEYLGQGVNGELFRVKESNTNNNFICKVIAFNKDYLKQLKRELGLLKTIQTHPIINEYINPCKKIFIRDNSIVSLFPVFNGVTLTNVIKLLNAPDFNSTNKLLLIKYIIKEILEAIFHFHDLNVSHLQLDTESILIELKEPDHSNLAKNNYKPSHNNRFNNENVELTKREKFIPTNMKVYTPELYQDEKPLQIKFTNFGIGCGKLTEYNIITGANLNSSKFQQCNIITFDKDPYITDYIQKKKISENNVFSLKNSEQLEMAKMYDIWLIGLIILQLIIKQDVYNRFVQSNESNMYKTVTTLFSEIRSEDLIDKSFELYMDNLKKYVLCPLKTRKNPKFVQEMIILDEKHDN